MRTRGSVLDMGMDCPESDVGLNSAIQIHMSSAPPLRLTMFDDLFAATTGAKNGFENHLNLYWLERPSFIMAESTRLQHDQFLSDLPSNIQAVIEAKKDAE